MSFLDAIFRKPEPLPHVVIRHVIATRAEDSKAAAKRRARRAKLEAQVAHLTAEQRAAARILAGRAPALAHGGK